MDRLDEGFALARPDRLADDLLCGCRHPVEIKARDHEEVHQHALAASVIAPKPEPMRVITVKAVISEKVRMRMSRLSRKSAMSLAPSVSIDMRGKAAAP